MALATYADLLASVASWTGRTDLASVIPDFVIIFEAVVNRRLRARQMETTATLTTSAGLVALPADYLGWRRLTWTGSTGIELKYKTPSGLRILFPQFVAGIPSSFTIEGSNIQTADTDDTTGAFTFEYYQKIPTLSGTVNWLYATHPDAYLFGTMTELYSFQKDADNVAFWGGRRDTVLDEIEALALRTRGPSAIMVASATP